MHLPEFDAFPLHSALRASGIGRIKNHSQEHRSQHPCWYCQHFQLFLFWVLQLCWWFQCAHPSVWCDLSSVYPPMLQWWNPVSYPQTKNNSVAGIDGITSMMLKHTASSISPILCSIFRCLQVGFLIRGIARLATLGGQDRNISLLFLILLLFSSIFPQFFLIFFLNSMLGGGGSSPTWEGPGYATVPDAWKLSQVVLVFKAGDPHAGFQLGTHH